MPEKVAAKLIKFQEAVDSAESYPARVQKAKDDFKNKKSNSAFKAVWVALRDISPGIRTCTYCEASVADEIEHIYPKDFYPEKVFLYENYLASCGPCNGPKNNKFAIFPDGGDILDRLERIKDAPIEPPTTGEPAFINPRALDPADFIELDVLGSFHFIPRDDLDQKSFQMAEYTLEILRLNVRDELVQARKLAFSTFVDRLHRYDQRKAEGANEAELAERKREFARMQHPTVLDQIRRNASLIPEISDILARNPELGKIFWFDDEE